MPRSPLNRNRTYPFKVAESDVSPSSRTFSATESRATIKIRTTWDYRYSVVRDVLGYSKRVEVDGAARIERHLPWQYPDLGLFLWAEQVENHRFIGKPSKAFDPRFGPYEVFTADDGYPVEMEVVFRARNFNVLDDDAIGDPPDESLRFVEYSAAEPSVEFLNSERGQMVFAEGPSTGQAFNSGWNIRLCKTVLKWTWKHVPFSAVHTADRRLNEKVLFPLGKVNETDYKGYPKGTLLLTGIKPILRTNILLDGIDPALSPGRVPLEVDVEYTLVHVDPPFDDATVSKARGWVLCPTKHATNKNWYLVTRDGTLPWPNGNGIMLYDVVEFADYLFKPF